MCVLIRNSVKICKDLEQSILFSPSFNEDEERLWLFWSQRKPSARRGDGLSVSSAPGAPLLGAHRHLGRDAPTLKSAGFPIWVLSPACHCCTLVMQLVGNNPLAPGHFKPNSWTSVCCILKHGSGQEGTGPRALWHHEWRDGRWPLFFLLHILMNLSF